MFKKNLELKMGVVVLFLLTITVPWFSSLMKESLGGLPIWFWYVFAFNIVFATAVCFMLEKSWDTTDQESQEAEEDTE